MNFSLKMKISHQVRSRICFINLLCATTFARTSFAYFTLKIKIIRLSLLYKSFLRSLLTYSSPGWLLATGYSLTAPINSRLNVVVRSPTLFGLGRNGCWPSRGSQLPRALLNERRPFNFQKARWDDFVYYFDSRYPSAE